MSVENTANIIVGNLLDNEIIINNFIDDSNNYNLNKSEIKVKNKKKSIKKKEKIVKDKVKNKIKKKEKIDDDNLKIPRFDEYSLLEKYDYKMSQLKTICKYYKLKQTGNKNELWDRIYNYLKSSINIIRLQALWRGSLIRKWLRLHGPAWNNRKICVNDQDFLSFEDLIDLKIDQFFSFKDKDNFVYGFDIISIYNLIKTTDKRSTKNKILNPYNRNEIDNSVIRDLNKLIRVSKIVKREISIDIPKEDEDQDDENVIRGRIVNVFQNIDLLGHYTQSQWFSDLSIHALKRFLKELCDIWTYRAQISQLTKMNIYPPNGDPFVGIYGGILSGLISINSATNIIELQKNCLTVIERMVNSGINNDFKNLGAYYVLTALTIVSQNAALALPWLFEAASSAGN